MSQEHVAALRAEIRAGRRSEFSAVQETLKLLKAKVRPPPPPRPRQGLEVWMCVCGGGNQWQRRGHVDGSGTPSEEPAV